MFTIEQIKAAHSKVKSGADFPKYIQEIKLLSVIGYETCVKDSHTKYFGKNGYHIESKPMYDPLTISEIVNKEKFSHCLKIHQEGKTDYHTFCKDCAETGIDKWVVSLDPMTCVYFDKVGNEVLVELIPS